MSGQAGKFAKSLQTFACLSQDGGWGWDALFRGFGACVEISRKAFMKRSLSVASLRKRDVTDDGWMDIICLKYMKYATTIILTSCVFVFFAKYLLCAKQLGYNNT